MNKIVYISGAITGVEDFMEQFNQAEIKLAAQGYSVLNPAKVMDDFPPGMTYEMYMDTSIAMLKHCDCIYMLPGWEKSRGAKHEHSYAVTYNLEVIMGKGD